MDRMTTARHGIRMTPIYIGMPFGHGAVIEQGEDGDGLPDPYGFVVTWRPEPNELDYREFDTLSDALHFAATLFEGRG